MNTQPDRRKNQYSLDEAKFSTQKIVTLILLTIFAAVTWNVLAGVDQAERSTILQTVINLTILGVGYWLGSSKGAADTNETIGRIAKGSPDVSAAAVAAAIGAPPPAAPAAGNAPEKEPAP